jgi:hypothetical protein
MQKISTRVVYQFNKEKNEYEKVDEDFYYYDGPMALAGMGGGSSGGSSSSTMTQKSEPWEPQQQYILAGLQKAKELFLDTAPPKAYPGHMVTPFSPETETALQLQTMRSLSQSPMEVAGNKNMLDTLKGSYLYGGSGFNNAIDAASRRIIPQVRSNFEGAGRTRSGLADAAVAQAIADPFAIQYGQERDNQFKANALVPTATAQEYADFGKLSEVGNIREQRTQDVLNKKIGRYDYNQNIMQQQVKDYIPLISGNYGGTVTGTQTGNTSQDSGGGSALGGIGQALLFSSMLGGGGGGAGIGGLLGGIGSIFGF